MKHYYSEKGECSECGRPTEVKIIDESFAERTILAVASQCCEAPVLDEGGRAIKLGDLEEAGYEG